jgi:site-specific recombinase XerD
MEQSFGLLFYLKKSGSRSTCEFPVYLRITVDGKVSELCTKRVCQIENWNSSSGRMSGKSEAAKELNAYLDVLKQKVFNAKRKLLETETIISCKAIKDMILGKEPSKKINHLIEIFKDHNNKIKTLVGTEYAPLTYQRYVTALSHTANFLSWKFGVNDIDIKKLDYEFITSFEFWLKSERKCRHNSTMKYLTNFKKIVNHCVKCGWLLRDPFIGYSFAKKEVQRVALTSNELDLLVNKRFEVERLNIVKDIFMFSCYTGLAYVDVKKLGYKDINVGLGGENWIYILRQKTNTSSKIPILPPAQVILDRYKNLFKLGANDKVLPVITNQKMNAYLKEIADLCGIKTNLTFHIARHTFATTVTLGNGVPIETVSKMLGHKDLRTTQHYAKILDNKIWDDMRNLKEKMFSGRQIN